jgi:hypothetical protein
MPRQQQERHQQQQGTAHSTLFDLDDAFVGATDEEHGQLGDVTFKDQVREELLSASRATAAPAAAATPPPRGSVAAATDIPMVNAVAVSASLISAEAEEERLHDVERRAAAAAAEAVRDQVAQLEQKLAAVRAPPRSGNRHDVSDTDNFDRIDADRLQDAERRAATAEAARRDQEVRLAQLERQLAHESNSNSGGSSPKQPSQRYRCCIVVMAVALLIAVAVAGICGTGSCSSPKPSPVPMPVVPSPMLQPVPVPVSIIPANTAPSRADTILPYINSITLSGRTLTYPSSSSAEERAVRWLINDDLGTAVDDEQSLRQRYVLGTLWFSPMTTTGFGSADQAALWTTNIDECQWWGLKCDGNGNVIAMRKWIESVRSRIPHDLGLLTDLTHLDLDENEFSGTIPSSLGALAALTHMDMGANQLNGTIPSSLGALTALTFLGLSTNQLVGTIPSSLGTLTALTFLDLSTNQLDGTIPPSLVTLTVLQSLWLFENQLVGTMPFCNSEQSLENLVADCARVNCTCCTHCCPAAFLNIPMSAWCQ